MKNLNRLYISLSLILSPPLFAMELDSENTIITEGNALESSLWTITDIPVCWENLDEIPVEEQQWVKDAVSRTWEAESIVKFTGWGACSNGSPGIHILVADSTSAPHVKQIGSNLDGYTNGMVLNHTYSTWSTSCQGREQYCSEVIAVHEFGHALGFVHEQNRPDTPETCNDSPNGSNGDLFVGEWDLDSVMNYCNPTWNNAGMLSDTDKEMTQLFYGEVNEAVGPVPVDICGVTSSADDGNVAANAIDGDFDTRWSAKGELQWIKFELCESAVIDRLDLAWFKGDVRASTFDVFYTLPSGTTYFPLNSKRTASGTTNALETEYFTEKEITHLTVRGFGNSANTWNSLTEAVIYTSGLQFDYPNLNAPSSLAVSLNGDDKISLTWTDTSSNEEGYVIEAEVDGGDLMIIGTTTSTSFTHSNLQEFGEYTYRVTAYSGILRSNFAEVSITRAAQNTDEGALITPNSASASSDDGNVAENVLDDDLSSRWSAKGIGEYLTLSLSESYTLTEINIAFYKGDSRQSNFQIEVSDDSTTWTQIYDGVSSGQTLSLESTISTQTTAKYVRIVGLGNSANTWNSVTEVNLIGYSQ